MSAGMAMPPFLPDRWTAERDMCQRLAVGVTRMLITRVVTHPARLVHLAPSSIDGVVEKTTGHATYARRRL